MTYTTALDTRYVPARLSRPSTEKLSQLFIRLDRELENGFSRGLVADTLITMNLMDNVGKEEAKFLDLSGHNYIRSKKLNSMSLKEYLQILETKFVDVASKDDPAKELECVDTFIRIVEEDKLIFLDRAMEIIKYHEMTPYEHKQRKKKLKRRHKLPLMSKYPNDYDYHH